MQGGDTVGTDPAGWALEGTSSPGCLTASVPAGSVQSAKGEASDEDEETEYFDAMEDAPAFITVTADPKHHRYHPRPAWEFGRGWEGPVFLQQSLPRGHPVGVSSRTFPASVQGSIQHPAAPAFLEQG